jgi:hypothetical protein
LGARRDPLGICAWRSVAHRILVRVELPFIQHWLKNRLPAITNLAGRLSFRMLGNPRRIGKWKTTNSWQAACNQSNSEFTQKLVHGLRKISRIVEPSLATKSQPPIPCLAAMCS